MTTPQGKVVDVRWQELAEASGYPNEITMLNELYIDRRMSTRQIGAFLGYDYCTVNAHLRKHGIQVRPRGGPNRTKATN